MPNEFWMAAESLEKARDEITALRARLEAAEKERADSVARWAMRSGKHAGERDNAIARAERAEAALEAMRKEQKADHANINLKADFIEKTLDQLAGAEARAERAEAALPSARRDAEPYIIKIGPDHGVCVGGRWDGWLFHKHADGHWVSQQKLASESLSSALAAPDAKP